eukprot:jgi/Phyca11/119903/e_gw1.40.314.1
MKFFNIAQLSDVYDWLNHSFVPAVFVTQDQNGYELPSEDYARVGLFNKGLGGVLIQVFRKSVDLLLFSLNATEASNRVSQWKETNMIDNSTGIVVITVLTYNGELQGYVFTQLTLEFQLGGFIKPDLSSRPMMSIAYGKQSTYAADILVWVWWTLAVMWALRRLNMLRKREKRPSRQEVILALCDLFSVEAVVCLNILTRTVKNALKQFGAFFVVFIVIFATFTIIGCMIFGDRAEEFSSLENSMASCINMLFGEFDFDAIKDLQFSVAFFWIYMIVVSIVLMNMMLGIVLDAYGEVSKASYNKTSNKDLVNRIGLMTWDMICELYLLLKPRAVFCHGKVRPRLLARALRKRLTENPEASSTEFTMETLNSLFPGRDLQLTEMQFNATKKHLRDGIPIVEALKSGEADSKKEY